jgi:3-oxoacid CoA-transferase subunit B/acetate CoA/acetoacetate CoA-transferase beta subunit
MGGAMDLVTGARRVIIATTLLTKKGEPKILEKCSLPLTGVKVVDTVVTEYALFRIIDGELTLCEVAPGVTEDDIRQNTFSGIKVLDELGKMTDPEDEQTQ